MMIIKLWKNLFRRRHRISFFESQHAMHEKVYTGDLTGKPRDLNEAVNSVLRRLVDEEDEAPAASPEQESGSKYPS